MGRLVPAHVRARPCNRRRAALSRLIGRVALPLREAARRVHMMLRVRAASSRLVGGAGIEPATPRV